MRALTVHRLCALAWTSALAFVFVTVVALWLLLWPVAVAAELAFGVHLEARVRALAARKAHVPASLRVRRRVAARPAPAVRAQQPRGACTRRPDRACDVLARRA